MRSILKTILPVALVGLVALGLGACSNDSLDSESIQTDANKAKKVDMTIKFGGELNASTTVSPITRADEDGNDLYGVFIEKANAIYAYGVYDKSTIENGLTVTFDDNQAQYNIYALMVVDAKDKLYLSDEVHTGEATRAHGYMEPFTVPEDSINHMMYNPYDAAYDDFAAFKSGIARLNDNETYSAPDLDMYYGDVSALTPTDEGSVEINMLRYTSEFAVNVTGLEEGESLTLTPITSGITPAISIAAASPSFDELLSMVKEESLSLTFQVKWINAEGEAKALYNTSTINIDLYRLKKTTANITLEANPSREVENSLTVTYDESPITEGETIDLSISEQSNE